MNSGILSVLRVVGVLAVSLLVVSARNSRPLGETTEEAQWNARVAKIRLGMSKEEVRAFLGEPTCKFKLLAAPSSEGVWL